MLRKASQLAVGVVRGASATVAEGGSQQLRRMAGGGHNAYHRTYNGKAVPASMQGPDYVTYAGSTIKKEFHPFDVGLSKTIGALATFTVCYHFYLNAEEHWDGDIVYFEKDVQRNGWGDEGHGHGHGHGEGHAHGHH